MSNQDDWVWVKLEWAEGESSISGPYRREDVEAKTQEELRMGFMKPIENEGDEYPRPVRVVLTEAPVNFWRNGKKLT